MGDERKRFTKSGHFSFRCSKTLWSLWLIVIPKATQRQSNKRNDFHFPVPGISLTYTLQVLKYSQGIHLGTPRRGLDLGKTPHSDKEVKELGKLGTFPANSAKQLSLERQLRLRKQREDPVFIRAEGGKQLNAFELCGQEGAPWKAKEIGKL